MTIRFSRHLAVITLVAAAASAAGIAVTWADTPGYLFMDIQDNSALVLHPPREQAMAQISKQPTQLPDDLASAIADGAQPIGASHIILAYHGQLYLLPDKAVKDGHMASHMVASMASGTSN